MRILVSIVWGAILAAHSPASAQTEAGNTSAPADEVSQTDSPRPDQDGPAAGKTSFALFAGGCFWCMEPPYDRLDGVLSTVSGYAGGAADKANYHAVSSGRTSHYEVIRVEYDPEKIGYRELLEVFWQNVDPFDAAGQFCDKGPQYRAAIFALTSEQNRLAEESKTAVLRRMAGRGQVETEILPAAAFYPAEDYHQDYYKKNPVRYKYYRWSCGREQRLQQVWARP